MMLRQPKRSRSPRERSPREATTPLDNPYLAEFAAPLSEEELAQIRVTHGNNFADLILHNPDSFFLSTFRRDRLVSKYAWAIPTEPAIRRIARLSPICDLGCGTGYWAYLLAQAGARVIAIDADPPQEGANHWHRATVHHFFPLVEGDAATFDVPRNHALMLCWPPYGAPMAAAALRRYRGSRVIYVGEGVGGCTGNDTFHHALAARWKLTELIDIPQWPGAHDRIYIYERKSRRAT